MKIPRFLLLLPLIGLGSLPAADQVPLPIQLPRPLFVGTPVPVQLPNLEKPSGTKRPDFLAPAGAVNLARGKPVTASDPEPVTGELGYLTDGDKTGIDGSVVEFGPGLQWAQIDLGTAARLCAVLCWHFHAQPRAYHAVIVQVSNDPTFKTGVTTLFNNDAGNSAKLGAGHDPAYIETYEGRLIDAKGVTARYVRLYSAGNTSDELNHYVEVEVYGLPPR